MSILVVAAAFGPTVQTRVRNAHMALTASLGSVKERFGGRSDLTTMVDEEDMTTTFAEVGDEDNAPPKRGDTITGTVVEMDDNGAMLQITGKMCGYLPLKEAALLPPKHVKEVVDIGQELTAEVVGTLKGMPVFSLRTQQLVEAWAEILKVKEADTIFEAKVTEVNKGGAVCQAFGLKAFLPGSHYLGVPDESLIGTTIGVKFLDCVAEEGKLVLSQRRALAESQVELEKGVVISGTITGLRNYGAFLELEGGTAGLLHISQISYDRIENLEQMFTIGQKCKVMVIEHDKQNGRVALSTKNLEMTPGDMKKDMQMVFDSAEENAKAYHERMESERVSREAAALDIVAGLDGVIGGGSAEPESVAESIENILASIVSDGTDAE